MDAMPLGKSKLGAIQQFFSGKGQDPSCPTSKPPSFLRFRSSTGFILTTICLAIFTDILLYGLIVPVIPFSLTVQVGVPEDQVQQWTAILLACYNVTLFVGSPIVGIYADISTSRRSPLLIGLLALAGSTLLLCLGKTMALLILGRLLQGLSAAIVWSVGLALLADTMGRNIGYAMGWVGIAMSVGLLISPVIGGAVYAAAGYYAVYYIAFAIIFLDIVLRLVLIEKKVARQWITDEEAEAVVGREGEGGGAPTSSNLEKAVGSDAAGKDQEGTAAPGQNETLNDGISPPTVPYMQTQTQLQTQAPGTGSESHGGKAARHPMLELIRSKRILAALFGTVIEAGIMFSFDTVVPLFVKDTFNWNSTAAGIIFICVMVPGFSAPLVGILADKFGAKWPSLAGFVVSIPLLVCLRFVTENSIGHKVLLGALLVLMGTSLTFSNTPLMAEITYAIEQKEARRPGMWGEKGVYGIGYGLFTTAFALGGTIGSLMAGYIVAGPGWGTATWALAVWCSAGAVVVFFWVGGKPKEESASDGDGIEAVRRPSQAGEAHTGSDAA